jgi:proline iminopeptidase
MERLRQHLGIDRWLLFGGSWGCTLALAYAERHPHRVTEMVLGDVTVTRRSEINWLYRGVAPLFPEEYECFRSGVPSAERDGDLVEAYHRLLQNPDPAIHVKAAQNGCAWENALLSIDPDAKPDPRRLQSAFQLAFARIVPLFP